MGTMYRNLSLSSPKTASLFAIDTSAILALTLAYNLAESLIQSTLAANLNSDTPYKKEVVMLLERSRESLREEYRTLSNNYGRLSEVVAKYNDLIKNQRSQQYVLNIVGDQSSKEVENEVTGGKS